MGYKFLIPVKGLFFCFTSLGIFLSAVLEQVFTAFNSLGIFFLKFGISGGNGCESTQDGGDIFLYIKRKQSGSAGRLKKKYPKTFRTGNRSGLSATESR